MRVQLVDGTGRILTSTPAPDGADEVALFRPDMAPAPGAPLWLVEAWHIARTVGAWERLGDAADRLGITRKTLWAKRKEYALTHGPNAAGRRQ